MTTTQEMRVAQLQREKLEETTAEHEPTDMGAKKHARRAERAAYLKEKLAERERAEREAAEEDAQEG